MSGAQASRCPIHAVLPGQPSGGGGTPAPDKVSGVEFKIVCMFAPSREV